MRLLVQVQVAAERDVSEMLSGWRWDVVAYLAQLGHEIRVAKDLETHHLRVLFGRPVARDKRLKGLGEI